MPRVQAPACLHPQCGARMVRAYIRDAGRFRPVGWFCPECAGFMASCPG